MKTKTTTTYECEFCGIVKTDKKYIEDCERKHIDILKWASGQSKWAKDFLKESGIKVYQEALNLLSASDNYVLIAKNYELGSIVYAIAPVENADFWLSALKTRQEAKDLCKAMAWKIK